MRVPSRALLLFLLLAGVAHSARGQASATVVIETNHPEALVYADTLWLGYASASPFLIPTTVREIRLVAQEENGWNIQPVIQSVDDLHPGSTYHLQLNFPYYYQVRSVPFDAAVYLEYGGTRQKIGETPLLYRSDKPLEGSFQIEHPGFIAQKVDPDAEVWNDVEVMLQPDGGEQKATEIAWSPPSQPRNWIDYAALGLAVTAGVATIHYKFKADNVYEEYSKTGDPALRQEIKKYDTRAGVSLGAMQVGLGVFAVRLFLRR